MTPVAATPTVTPVVGRSPVGWFAQRTGMITMTTLLVLVATVVLTLGGLALARMSTLEAATRTLASESAVGLRDIGDLRADVSSARLDAANQLISSEPASSRCAVCGEVRRSGCPGPTSTWTAVRCSSASRSCSWAGGRWHRPTDAITFDLRWKAAVGWPLTAKAFHDTTLTY